MEAVRVHADAAELVRTNVGITDALCRQFGISDASQAVGRLSYPTD
jgi:hypothetical protein